VTTDPERRAARIDFDSAQHGGEQRHAEHAVQPAREVAVLDVLQNSSPLRSFLDGNRQSRLMAQGAKGFRGRHVCLPLELSARPQRTAR
jgi:hypothetical protein